MHEPTNQTREPGFIERAAAAVRAEIKPEAKEAVAVHVFAEVVEISDQDKLIEKLIGANLSDITLLSESKPVVVRNDSYDELVLLGNETVAAKAYSREARREVYKVCDEEVNRAEYEEFQRAIGAIDSYHTKGIQNFRTLPANLRLAVYEKREDIELSALEVVDELSENKDESIIGAIVLKGWASDQFEVAFSDSPEPVLSERDREMRFDFFNPTQVQANAVYTTGHHHEPDFTIGEQMFIGKKMIARMQEDLLDRSKPSFYVLAKKDDEELTAVPFDIYQSVVDRAKNLAEEMKRQIAFPTRPRRD